MPSRTIQEMRPGDYVRVGGQLKEIRAIHGVNLDGTLAKPSEGGFWVETTDDQRIDMWHADAYLLRDDVQNCPCGKPLHYNSAEAERFVEGMIIKLGPYVPVTVDERTWLVPRHYIALHGLKASELPTLGFEEITRGDPT